MVYRVNLWYIYGEIKYMEIIQIIKIKNFYTIQDCLISVVGYIHGIFMVYRVHLWYIYGV